MDRRAAGALLALAACIACTTAAPMASSNQTALDVYDGASEGCYYNFQHYGEGDRIMTNEPCLNCTCHNRMLMCYLRVCPFTKPIGQDCTVEKRADQCCPIVTCPDVPVDLLTSTSTTSPAEYGATGIGKQDKYGCSINGRYFPEGSKVPPSPNKPCEHCYCIRNMTTCVMQECTLHVDGCVPIYHKDVCCPVRYSCDHPEDEIPLLDDMTTTVRPTPGFLLTTTTLTPVTQASQDCVHDDKIFADGALIKTEKACEHCYCMKGDIVCVVQECGTPMENEGKNCTSLPPRHGQCCPDTYICEGDELVTDQSPEATTQAIVASTNPPRKAVEGSGYRKETDESYTDMPIFDTTEPEGSGEDQPTLPIEPETVMPDKPTPDLEDEMFLTTAKESELKPHSSTAEPSLDETKVPKSEDNAEQSSPEYEQEISTESTKPDVDEQDESLNKEDDSAPVKDVGITDGIKESQEPLLTTITGDVYDISSSSEGLTSREDQSVITTESSFRKEDFIPTITDKTSQSDGSEIITEGIFNEESTEDTFKEATTRGMIIEAVTQGVFNEVTTEVTSKDETENEYKVPEEEHKELVTLSQETATPGTPTYVEDALVTIDSSGIGDVTQDEKEISDEYGSSTTRKSELSETTTLNPIENEIVEDSHDSSGRIPGEGDCLLNGITYKNYTTVPSTNKCHTQCRCVSSIVKCDPIICSPPPEYANMNQCQPIYDSAESCCPTYICDQSKDTILPESHSQMSGTESTRPIYGSECKGDECRIIENEEKVVPVQTAPSVPDCGTEDCGADIGSSTGQTKECDNGKCEESPNKGLPCDASTGCQVSPVKPCEGDDCTVHHHVDKPADQVSAIEKECDSDSCRRKETAQDTQQPSTVCNGDQCGYPQKVDSEIKEVTTQTPFIPEATKIIEKDDSTTISPDYSIIKPQETTTTLEEQTPYESSSKIIESDIEEHTTKYEEYHPEITDASIIPGDEHLTSKQPLEEVDVNEISTEHSPHIEMDTTVIAAIKENEYLPTTSHSLLTEPTLAEENTETHKTEEEITLDEKKFTTEASVPGLESHETTIADSDKLTTPYVHITSSPQDDEKETVMLDINTKMPVQDNEKDLTETDVTETTITKDITDKELVEKDLTTLLPSSQDIDYTTEAHISKAEQTTSNTINEIVTKSEEAPGVDENLTEEIIDNLYTTQRNVESTKLHDIPTDGANVDHITDHSMSPVSSTEWTERMTTESINVDAMEEKITQQMSDDSIHGHEIETVTTEAIPSDTEQYKTTKLPDSLISEDALGTKEPEQEELITNVPVTVADKTSQTTDLVDQMESLNGRATESPQEVVGTESSAETDMYYTTSSEGIATDFDKTQTELAEPGTENIFETSQKPTSGDIVTKLPSHDGEEVTKFEPDTQMLTTEPSRRADVTSEVSQAVDDHDENIISTDIIKELTTVLPSSSDLQEQDKDSVEEKDTEPQEVTQKSEPHISTALDTATEPLIDVQKLSTPDIDITEKEEHPTSGLVDNTSESHDIEISTSKVNLNIESITESIIDDLTDVTKNAEEVKTSEDDHQKISTEPTEVFTTSQDDLSLSRTTLLPETSESVLQTSTTKQDKDSVTSSYGVVDIDKSEEAITKKPEGTTSAAVISETDDMQVTTIAYPTMEEVYSHDITTEANLIVEKETIDKATIVPQTIIEEETGTGSPEKEAAITTQGLDLDSSRPTTEIPEIQTSKEQQSAIDQSITTDVHDKDTYSDKLDHPTTETAATLPEKDISSTQLKDKSSEVPDFITPTSQTEVTEIITDVQEPSKTTYQPDLVTSQDITTEKNELTKSPDQHINVDENTTQIKDIVSSEEFMAELTESPEKLTIDDKEGEPVEGQLTTDKITEDLTQTPDEDLMTESPDISIKVTGDLVSKDHTTIPQADIQGETTTPILVTESAKITTEATHSEEQTKYTKIPEPGVQKEVSLEDKDEFTESSVHKVTDMPITLSLETVTETAPEYINIKEQEKTVTQKEQTEDLLTASPEAVTEIMKDNIDETKKTMDLPKVTDAPTSKVTDILEEVTKLLDQETQEEATEKPTIESSSLYKDADKETTISSEVYVPIETTSQLPEDESTKKHVTFATEKYIEHSTDKSAETEDENLATKTELSPTSTSHDGLDMSDISVITESVAMAAVDKTHDTDISHDDKLASEMPTSSTQTNEEDLLKDSSPKVEQEEVTQGTLDSILVSETYTKAESTTEKEYFGSDKVHKDEEAITSSYVGEQYTQLPEQLFTDQPKPATEASDSITNDEMEKTEISVTTIQQMNEERVSTDVPQVFTTQRSETETEISATLSTETHTLVPEVVHMVGDQIKETEVSELQTEVPTSMPHIAQKETADKESFSTETPVSVTTTSDEYSAVTNKIYHETTSQPREPDYIATERIEIPSKVEVGLEGSTEIITEPGRLDTKPADETTKATDYETSKPAEEFSESTPYFIELEEHTHKSIEQETPEVHHEDETSTVTLESQHADKEEYDVTTESKVYDQKQQTEETPIESETTAEEEKRVSTTASSQDDLDKFYSTEIPQEKSTEHPIEYEKPTTSHAVHIESETEATKPVKTSYDKETPTPESIATTLTYEKEETPKHEEQSTSVTDVEKEITPATDKPLEAVSPVRETTAPEEEFIPAVTKGTTKIAEDITTLPPTHFDKFTSPQDKPTEIVLPTSPPELPKPGFNDVLPTDDIPSTDNDSHFPPTGSSGYGQEPDYGEEDQVLEPGTCRYGGKTYLSAQQIPRDDPCDFCFCFRSDIICLQQSCPPPIHGCHEEPIQGFCCPRYECPVSMATTLNITTTTTTTTTTLPPHFLPHAYKGAAQRRGCQIKGHSYKVGEVVRASSGPCLHCTCGGDGQMKCDPKACTPEPMLRHMIAAAVSAKRRR